MTIEKERTMGHDSGKKKRCTSDDQFTSFSDVGEWEWYTDEDGNLRQRPRAKKETSRKKITQKTVEAIKETQKEKIRLHLERKIIEWIKQDPNNSLSR